MLAGKPTGQAFQAYVRARLLEPSLLGIMSGNLLSMVLALWQGWQLSEILWLYWGQSVALGVFNFFRIWNLKNFTSEGLSINGTPVLATAGSARSTAIFFAFHYGFFHLIYSVFLVVMGKGLSSEAQASVVFCVVFFVFSHAFSLVRNARDDLRAPTPNLGMMMLMPYLRIIPMHLTITFGGMAMGAAGVAPLAIVLFMGLKSLADGVGHMLEHYLYQFGNDD